MFSISREINSSVYGNNFDANEVFVSEAIFEDVNGNIASASVAELNVMNSLLYNQADITHQINPVIPDAPDTTPPLLELTELRIEHTDIGNYWRISGNIEDTSPIQSFVILSVWVTQPWVTVYLLKLLSQMVVLQLAMTYSRIYLIL